jgi:hypothetical protein
MKIIKYKTIFTFFLIIVTQGSSYAIATPENYTGVVNIENNTINKELEISGYTSIKNSTLNASLNHLGEVEISHSALQNLSSNGITIIEYQTAIKGSLTATGKLRIHDAGVAGETIVNGSTVAKNVKFSGNFTGYGYLGSENSTFKNITIEGDNVDFIDSRADSLVIKKPKNPNTVQTVKITGNSQIANKITFESGNGQIITHGHLVEIGKVEGASVNRN